MGENIHRVVSPSEGSSLVQSPKIDVSIDLKDVLKEMHKMSESMASISEVLNIGFELKTQEIEAEIEKFRLAFEKKDFKVTVDMSEEMLPPEVTVNCEHPVYVEPQKIEKDESLRQSIDKASHSLETTVRVLTLLAAFNSLALILIAYIFFHALASHPL